ncbi:MAG: tRNA lysidine(34) synthetase TilS [Pyrinomonadaceae bacterium]
MTGRESQKFEPAARPMSGRGVSRFARRLLAEWRRLALPSAGEPSVIAVSGGADSCALLLALDELTKAGRFGWKLTVAHLDHGLRGEAGAGDAIWVGELAEGLGYECVAARASVAERAGATGDNLEQAARGARYEFLARAARASGARFVLTGHTLDDQAETVLLALLRGSGAEGLGGMSPVRPLDELDDVKLVRPLLGWARRAETESYCRARGVKPRADAMNEDESFKRVRVRRQLVPLLESFNPRAVEAVARAAELLRGDAAALEEQAATLLAVVGDAKPGNSSVSLGVEVLRGANVAVRRRALRLWLKRSRGSLRRVELAHVLAVERLLEGERGGRVAELPGGCVVERRLGRLWFRAEVANRPADGSDSGVPPAAGREKRAGG